MAAPTRQIQSSFANGVISPRVLGRVDQEKYKHSAEKLQNVIVLPQGAVKRRPGTQWVADAMGPSRLVPFVFSPGQAYILELGNQQVRFYYADNTSGPWTIGKQIQVNGAPLTLTTPYDTTQTNFNLWDIHYAQQGDIIYFYHNQFPVQKLIRYGQVGLVPSQSDTGWRWEQVTWDCPPTDQFDQDISTGTITLTPGTSANGSGDATTAGATLVPFTASASGTFLDGDVGKFIVVGTQLAKITSTTQPTRNNKNVPFDNTGTIAYCTILDPFFSLSAIAAGLWLMRGSPSVWISIGFDDPNGNPQGGGEGWSAALQFGIGLTENAQTFFAYPSTGFPAPKKATAFRPGDVGRYIVLAGCTVQIVEYIASNQITVQYLSVPEDTFAGQFAGLIRVSPVAGGAWTIEDPIWGPPNNDGTIGSARGYPAVGTFFGGRHYLAATAFQPKTFWGSQVDNFENFAKGNNAGDGLEYGVSGGQLDTINWMHSTPVQGNLAVETDATEYVASGGGGFGNSGAPITPTSVQVNANSAQGGSRINPILVDNQLVYIQRYRTKVFEFSYNIYQSSFSSRDLSLFAEHLTHAGIKEAAYQPIPYKIIWFVTFDGRLLGMTYDKTQDVLAWHEHRTGYADQGYGAVGTGDKFLSIAVIPNPSPILSNSDGSTTYAPNASATYASDLAWVVVQRTRNGQTVYTIELMNENLNVDCSKQIPTNGTYTSITDANLAGRVVAATGIPFTAGVNYFPFDSSLLDDLSKPAADSTGKVTLAAANKAQSITSYGLPFQPLILTCRPENPQVGTIQGALQQWSEYWLRVFNTMGLIVNGQDTDKMNSWETYMPEKATPADTLEPGKLQNGQNLDQTYAAALQTLSDEVSPTTRDIRVQALGFDRAGRVLITQYQPMPLTVLCTFGKLKVGSI